MRTFTFCAILAIVLLLSPDSNGQHDRSITVSPQSEITYRVSTRSNQQLTLFARVSTLKGIKGSTSGIKLSGGLPIVLPASNLSNGEIKKLYSGVTVGWMPSSRAGHSYGQAYLRISRLTSEGVRIQSKSAKVKLNSKGNELRIDMNQPEEGYVEITVGNTGKKNMVVDGLHMNSTNLSKTIKRSDNDLSYFTLPTGQPDGDCANWWSDCQCWTSCDPYHTGGTFGVPVIVVGSAGGSGSGTGGGGGGGGAGGGGGGGGSGGDPTYDDGGTTSAIDEVPEKQARSFIARKFNCSTSVPLYVNVGDSPTLSKLGWTITTDGNYQNSAGRGALAFVGGNSIATGALIGTTINVSPAVSANASDCEKYVIYGHEMIHVMHYNEHWSEAQANGEQFNRCTEYAAYKWTLNAIAAAPCTSDLLTQIKNTANAVLADATQTQNCNWNYNYSCIPNR